MRSLCVWFLITDIVDEKVVESLWKRFYSAFEHAEAQKQDLIDGDQTKHSPLG